MPTQALTIDALVQQLATVLTAQGQMLATAESCTGGMIAAACTDLAGSSQWFERGFVTYSNAAKHELLSVPETLIEAHGAVSQPVAQAMACGAVTHSHAHCAVAVTGVAGPGGGSDEKPVGTVWFGWSVRGQWHTEHKLFAGDRAQVRSATVQHALTQLLTYLTATQAP